MIYAVLLLCPDGRFTSSNTAERVTTTVLVHHVVYKINEALRAHTYPAVVIVILTVL